MKCQLSLAQKIRSIEEKLIVLARFEIHKKMSFEEKIMNSHGQKLLFENFNEASFLGRRMF